jgi:hypothetical protein
MLRSTMRPMQLCVHLPDLLSVATQSGVVMLGSERLSSICCPSVAQTFTRMRMPVIVGHVLSSQLAPLLIHTLLSSVQGACSRARLC